MNSNDELITSSTLLRSLRDTGDAARWAYFEKTYSHFIKSILYGLLGRYGSLQPEMFEDVMQETMIALMKQFPTFEYDRNKGTFRGYLYGIVVNKVKTLLRKHAKDRKLQISSEVTDIALERQSMESDADAVAERLEITHEIWVLLLRRVFDGSRYTCQSQEVFTALVSGTYSVDELAQKYGMKPNAIYQLRSRVMRDIKAIIKSIEYSSGDLLDLLESMLNEERENEKRLMNVPWRRQPRNC